VGRRACDFAQARKEGPSGAVEERESRVAAERRIVDTHPRKVEANRDEDTADT
jgi:hypothetical protein